MSRFASIASVVFLTFAVSATAQVVIETVTVSNPGNAGELSGESASNGWGPDRICGAVDYIYNIGKFEVTAGQYTEFLNAVAAEDTYGLYEAAMRNDADLGCMIERSGYSPHFDYEVAPDRADRPVNWVSWGDAARFCNWLHNGQPGIIAPGVYDPVPQDENSTEDGSYFLNGAMEDEDLMAVVREPDATWAIPSEDEWYKAAYHKNDGPTGRYWGYPMSSDTTPSNVLVEPTDPGNNATFNDSGYTIGTPYYRTEGGAHENSDSPYGTFDQGGNVWEWNEAVIDTRRGLRGGSFDLEYDYLRAASRGGEPASITYHDVGFRVVGVYESVPTTSEWGVAAMALLLLTAGTVVLARRRRAHA